MKTSWRTLRSVQVAGSIIAMLACSSAAPVAHQQVDVKLVLATDVSRSIDDDEARLEREGTAEAFLAADVVKAIQGGALGKIAVAMLDFSSPDDNKIVIDWQIVHDRASAAALAELIRDTPRTPGRRTSISSALELGSLLLESSDKDIVATRKVIDVSGDGPNNDGNPMRQVHDKIIAQGIVVNGLPVMDDNGNGYFPELDKYYAACVAGGRGSFVVPVHSFKDFGIAMRHKLILEISRNETQSKEVNNSAPRHGFLFNAAAQLPAQEPQVLRPGNNEFSQQCDIAGGFFGGGFGRF